MSQPRTRRVASIAAASALLIGGAALSPLNTQAMEYTPIAQADMSAVETISADEAVELPNGPQLIVVVVPDGAVELIDGDFKVRMHPTSRRWSTTVWAMISWPGASVTR